MTKKRPGGKLPPFVAITWNMLNSQAYKELPPTACKMLPYFLGKPKLPSTDKNYYQTEFTFPYAEGANYGCARKTFSEVVKGLMKHGFIDPVKKGGRRCFGLGPSMFKLSKRWEAYGTFAFQEVRWESFGQDQIRCQVQKLRIIGAENEPK